MDESIKMGQTPSIRMFATRERKIMMEVAAQGRTGEKIERKWLFNLLYLPIDEVSSLSREQLDRIIGEYLIIGRVYDAVAGFQQTLFGKKNPRRIIAALSYLDTNMFVWILRKIMR